MLRPPIMPRLHVTDLHWSSAPCGRMDEVIAVVDAVIVSMRLPVDPVEADDHLVVALRPAATDDLRLVDTSVVTATAPVTDVVQMIDLLGIKRTVPLDVDPVALETACTVQIRPSSKDALILTDPVHASMSVSIPTDALTLTDPLHTSMIGSAQADVATLTDPLHASMIGSAQTDVATLTDDLAGDLCAGSCFGRSLLGDALFG